MYIYESVRGCYRLKIRFCTLYYSELKMTDELLKHVFKKWRSVRNSTITVGTLFGDHTADKKITGTRRMAAPVGVMGCLRFALNRVRFFFSHRILHQEGGEESQK